MDQDFIREIEQIVTKGTVAVEEPMSRHTSFQVGGPADLFVSPGTKEELARVTEMAGRRGIPFFVVGNGSNLLVSDEGYRGLILQIGRHMADISVDGDVITAEAGAMNAAVARVALEQELSGMEFAAGIPGSIGGAAAMNAGAYGGEMKDILLCAEVLTQEGHVLELKGEEMDLAYRHSCIFEKNYIVLSVKLGLHRGRMDEIRSRMDDFAGRRRDKQPLEFPSAGSTFKRPEGYFAGKLIQDAGLKGYTVGGAQVSEKHSGFVINRGGATAAEISFLMQQVQKKVYAKYGVILEPEVRMLGFQEE